MTTHRKALARVGVAAVAVLGSLVVAGPAHADPSAITVSLGSLQDFSPGQSQTLAVTVTYTASTPPQGGLLGTPVKVQLSNPTNATVVGSDCGGTSTCTLIFDNNASSAKKTVNFTLQAAGSVDPGQQKPVSGTVTASDNSSSGSASFSRTVKGPQPAPTQAPTVTQVTGTVKDSATGAAVKGALVMLVDSGGGCGQGKCQTGTDNKGFFKFTPKTGQTIAPGTLQIGVTKDGYDNLVRNVDAAAGQSVSVQLALKPLANASASASPEALPSADGQVPSADAGTQQAPAAPNTQKAASSSGLSAFSWIILALAILLVLAGVGVFVMLFINRRKREAEDDGDGGNAPTGPDAPMGTPGAGVYGGADPTMVGHGGMTHAMRTPGAADATAIIPPSRPEDEFPDPYAAPYPTNMPGYTGNGYGGQQAYGGDPNQAGGYPAGYDPTVQQDYAGAPTSAYNPAGAHGGEYGNGYGAQAGYGGAPAGYGGEPGYGGQQPYGGEPGYGGQQPYGGEPGYGGSSNGYGGEPGYGGQQQAYGAPGGQAPGYDQPTGQWNGEEYPETGAHQQGGYQQQQHGGHDPRTAYDQRGGYEQQNGGYDAAGYPPPQDPYYQEEPPQPPQPAQPGAGRRTPPSSGRGGDRQQLNWLDD